MVDQRNHVTLTLLPDWLELVKVLTRAVRSMDSAGNSGKSDDLYSTFNLDSRNTWGRGGGSSISDQYLLHQRRSDGSSLLSEIRNV